MTRWHPSTALIALVCVSGGCATHRAVAVSQACGPPAEERLAPGTVADGLDGTFGMTLVATEGPAVGRVVQGTVTLALPESASRPIAGPGGTPRTDARVALIGKADLDLAAVGALRMGEIQSSDPVRPGVAVLERHVVTAAETTLTEITLRLGSEANRRDVVRFDGGFTALYVRTVSRHGFGGHWASGISRATAQGHFCAARRAQ